MSTVKVNTLTGTSTAGSISVTGEGNSTTTNLQQGLAKVWASILSDNTNFSDSFNCSSLADNGNGDGTPSFTSSLSNANYAHSLGHRPGSLTSGASNQRNIHVESVATGNINLINSFTSTGGALTFYDVDHTFAINGDLA